jgi:transcription termination factor NusB
MTPRLYKLAASTIEMGSPQEAGKGIADIVKFLMTRINDDKYQESLNKIRDKIWYLNEYDISSKKTPASASLGQSITFIKTILNGHQPKYIRDVLNNIVRNL